MAQHSDKRKQIIHLSLGTNMGDRFTNLKHAREFIASEIGQVFKSSSIYETESWGFETKNDFLNQVIAVNSFLSPTEILNKCLAIENKLGRKRTEVKGYQNRIIDIDILLIENEVINENALQVPHPLLIERSFVLVPLHEIYPNGRHPILKKSIKELLDLCADKSKLKRI